MPLLPVSIVFGTVGALFGVALQVLADELDDAVKVVNEAVKSEELWESVVLEFKENSCVEEDELIEVECPREEELLKLGDEFAGEVS